MNCLILLCGWPYLLPLVAIKVLFGPVYPRNVRVSVGNRLDQHGFAREQGHVAFQALSFTLVIVGAGRIPAETAENVPQKAIVERGTRGLLS